jgi:hypothetical protein
MSAMFPRRVDVLASLEEWSRRTAPVHLSIGYTDSRGMIHHGAIIVRSAPGAVVEKIMKEWSGVAVSLIDQGLIISTDNDED